MSDQLREAVANLINVKGRFHTEQAYQRLFEAYDALESSPVQAAEPTGPGQWLPMYFAPKDGTMLRLLVEFEENSTEDAEGPSWTIGFNNLEHDGEDLWRLAGWDWSHDCFTQGTGKPVGWLPLLATPPSPTADAGTDPVEVVHSTVHPGLWMDETGRYYKPITKEAIASGEMVTAPAVSDEIKQLMDFYSVSSTDDLIAQQARHIEKLQAGLAKAESGAPSKPRFA